MRRVVVTGLGMLAPCGNSVETAWEAALAARSGVARISRFDPERLPVHIAAEVKDFQIGDALDHKEARRATRFVQYAVYAARDAMRDAGLFATGGIDPLQRDRWGCSIGVGIGSLEDIEENTRILDQQGAKRVSPFFIPMTIPNMAAGLVSRLHHLRGPNICPTTACSSGTHGVGEAFLYIKNGMADVMVAGGTESAISPLGIASFAALKALSTNNTMPESASRPFDLDRDGFVMGEGSGLLVLEELASARRRGARIYCEMVGYGMSGDAHHITAPPPEGEGAQRCMAIALANGTVPRDQVDYINAHGTSTELNDRYESAAIAKVFGEYAKEISISSTKGVTGHCLGAAGGIEAVYTVLALHRGVIPPTANLRTPDPECPLDYTPLRPKERRVRYAMSNSFGFGGTNATIIFKRFEG